jgi:hypothetical protein
MTSTTHNSQVTPRQFTHISQVDSCNGCLTPPLYGTRANRRQTPKPTPAWAKAAGVGRRAIAIGDPLGASSTRIMTTMVNALEQRRSRPFLAT